MNPLDTLLTSCIEKPETPKRRPSLISSSSEQSKSQTLISSVVDEFVAKVSEIPAVIEQSVDEFINTMKEVPIVLEESLGGLTHTYCPWWTRLKLRLFPQSGRGKLPCVKVSRHDFEQVGASTERALLRLKNDLSFQDLMEHVHDGDVSRESVLSWNCSSSSLPSDLQHELAFLRDLRAEIHLMELSSPGVESPNFDRRSNLTIYEDVEQASPSSTDTFFEIISQGENARMVQEVEHMEDVSIPKHPPSVKKESAPYAIGPGIIAV